jgi:hypothetical protein
MPGRPTDQSIGAGDVANQLDVAGDVLEGHQKNAKWAPVKAQNALTWSDDEHPVAVYGRVH